MLGFPLATVPLTIAYPPNPNSGAFIKLINEGGEGQYLVEISAYKGGEARSGGLATWTEIPLASIPKGSAVSVGLVTLRYADGHWVGDPDDERQANTYYEGRVTIPLVMERNMPLLPEEARRVQRQFGNIEIANGDGALDAILQSYAIDGRRVRVLFGPKGGAYKDFGVIADVLGTGWEGDEVTVRLGLRDQSYSLDLPFQTNLYLGTGDDEGTEENKGKTKPVTFGRCRNITPVLIDPVNLIYQWHDGSSEALDDVFERGLALTASGDDVVDYSALVSQSVAAGEYATCLASSLFKLGDDPLGLITCDVRGDNDPDYADTFDIIALRVLQRGGLASRWINRSTFAGAAAIGGEMGIYVASGNNPSTADIMNTLTASIAGWWGAARDGRVRAGRLTAPENRTPNLYLDQFNILNLEPESTPVPRWRQRVAYKPNWTEQRGEDLAGAVTTERRQFLTETARVVSSADAVTKIRHLQALDPEPMPTLYENATDAESIAEDLLALHSPDRHIYSVTVKRFGYRLDLGSIVRVTYPKFRLSTGQNFVVIGIREDADQDSQTLKIWG